MVSVFNGNISSRILIPADEKESHTRMFVRIRPEHKQTDDSPSLLPLYPNPNDVFLGRGGARANYFYRKLIRVHSKEYCSLRVGKKKEFLIAKIITPIVQRGGKFYIRNPADDFGVWRAANDHEVIKKLRGALTDYRKKMLENSKGQEESEDEQEDPGVKQAEETPRSSPIVGAKRKLMESCRVTPPSIVSSSSFQSINAAMQNPSTPRTGNTQLHAMLRDQAKPFVLRRKPSTPPKTTLYLNERTGHLLNMMTRDNLYHRLLVRYARPFHDRFSSRDPIDVLWNDDGRIRFVWNNIITELKKANCHIVLCPESQRSIDVDPNTLQLLHQDPEHVDTTFRTIRCIITAICDHNYVGSQQEFIRSIDQAVPESALVRQVSNDALRREMHAIQRNAMARARQSPPLWLQQQEPAVVSSQNLSSNVNTIPIGGPGRPRRVSLQPSSPDQELVRLVQTAMTQNALAAQKAVEENAIAAQKALVEQVIAAKTVIAQEVLAQEALAQEAIAARMERERQLQMIQHAMRMSADQRSSRVVHMVEASPPKKLKPTRDDSSRTPQANSKNRTTRKDPEKVQGKAYPWERHYKELLEYFLEYGDLRVPQHYEKDPSLGRFVASVRFLRREKSRGGKRRLEDHKEVQLNKIGFSWDGRTSEVFRSPTEQRAIECFVLKEFGRTHPGMKVSLDDPSYSWLAEWIEARRATAKGSDAIWNEAQLMEKLGFEWEGPSKTVQTRERQIMSPISHLKL